MPIKGTGFTTNNQISTYKNSNAIAFKTKPIEQDKNKISSKKEELPNTAKVGIYFGILTLIGLGIYNRRSLKNLWEKTFESKSVSNNNAVNKNKKYLDKINEIKENFSKIFDRDFTKDEANELALKYKEIFETENNKEFMGKIFEQIRKDYNLPEIPYKIEKMPNNLEYACWSMTDGVTYNLNLVKFVIENGTAKFTEINRPHIAMSLAHEMKHATQDKLANQVDIQKNILAYIDREQRYNSDFWKKNLMKYNNNIEETKEKLVEQLYNSVIPSFKNLEKISKDAPLYQKGLEYIDGVRNYIRPEGGLERYRSQLIEKEAHDAGSRMEQIYKWLTNK